MIERNILPDRRRVFAGLCAGAVALSMGALGLGAAPAAAKEKVTYGYLIDPALEGVLYAIKQGIVKSDKIEIDGKALAIPALIQSTPTKRFDVLMNAVMAIPLAAKRGLKLVVLSSALRAGKGGLGAGIWVKKDSPYKTMADLKGKTIGNYALRATGTTWIRLALLKKYKLNVSYKGGDMNWVQIPAPALLTALETGRVDAATLIHSQAYRARGSGNYRVLAWTNKDIRELYGVDTVAAVNVTYPGEARRAAGGVPGIQPDAVRIGAVCREESRRGRRGDRQGRQDQRGLFQGLAGGLFLLPGRGFRRRHEGDGDDLVRREGDGHPQVGAEGRRRGVGARHPRIGAGQPEPDRWTLRQP